MGKFNFDYIKYSEVTVPTLDGGYPGFKIKEDYYVESGALKEFAEIPDLTDEKNN